MIVDEWEMSFQDKLKVKRCPKHSSVCTSQHVQKSFNGNKNVDKIVSQASQMTFAIYMHVRFILELISCLLNFYSLNDLARFSRSSCILHRRHGQWAQINTTYITILLKGISIFDLKCWMPLHHWAQWMNKNNFKTSQAVLSFIIIFCWSCANSFCDLHAKSRYRPKQWI